MAGLEDCGPVDVTLPPLRSAPSIETALAAMDRTEAGQAGAPLRLPLRSGSVCGGGAEPGALSSSSGPGTKKMRKRRELDALAKRCPPAVGHKGVHVHKRCSGSGGVSSHDQLLSESSAEDSTALGLKAGYSGYALSAGYSLASNGYTPGFTLGVKRRRPPRGPYGSYPHLGRTCPGPCAAVVRACVALLVLACVIANLTVMWLFIDVREQVSSLRTEIEQVVAGSQAVPDDLQKIHSLSRELQQNQTQLTLRVNTISAQISNLSQQLVVVQSGLRAYSDQLQSNPEPSSVKELMTNVALWGSQIKDLDNTVRSLKQRQAALDTFTQILGKNLTAVEISIVRLSNTTIRPSPLEPNIVHNLESLQKVIAQASANISETNSTLTKRLQWLQDDLLKDHKAVEILQDLGQNFTASIKNLEGECAKVDAQNTLNNTLLKLKDKVIVDSQRLDSLSSAMAPLIGMERLASGVTQSSVPGKLSAGSSSSMVEEARESLSPLLSDTVDGGITTPGG